jgi:hypothetical protein
VRSPRGEVGFRCGKATLALGKISGPRVAGMCSEQDETNCGFYVTYGSIENRRSIALASCAATSRGLVKAVICFGPAHRS